MRTQFNRTTKRSVPYTKTETKIHQKKEEDKFDTLLQAVNEKYNESHIQDNTPSFSASYSDTQKKNAEKMMIESASLIQFVKTGKRIYNYNIPEHALSCLGCMGSIKGQFLRDAVETISPTQQCMKTIGEPQDGSLCYLCGLPMNIDDPKDLKPECEHVLPILQALILSDIYSKDSRDIIPSNSQIFKVEYKWAHKHCNAMKSNISLIIFDATTRMISPNEVNIVKLLKKIFFKNINKIKTTKKETREDINNILNDIINKPKLAKNEKVISIKNTNNLLHSSLIQKLKGKTPHAIKEIIQKQKTEVKSTIQDFCILYNQRVLSNPGLNILATAGSISTIFKNIVNKLEYNINKAQETDDS